MLPNLNSQYLFILPLPYSAPSSKASLYGVAYVLTDAAFNILGQKGYIKCKGIEYLLPSPVYLFSQGIDPYTIKAQQTEEKFLKELNKLLTTPNLSVFTWSSRNFKIVEAMELRNINLSNTLSKLYTAVDINKVLKLSEILNTGKITDSDNLVACAQKYGFQGKPRRDEHFVKLDALLHLVKYLHDNHTALLNYMLKDFNSKRAQISKFIQEGKCLIDFNVKTKSLEILKPLDLQNDVIKALYFDGNTVCGKYYDLLDLKILSPVAVLTPERQATTNIDANSIVLLLNSTDINSIEFDNKSLPLRMKFFDKFTDVDLKLYTEYSMLDRMSLIEPPLSSSEGFRRFVFLFRGNNYKGTFIDTELHSYYKVCRNLLESQFKGYFKEVSGLSNSVNEEDDFELQLVKKIQSYPIDLQ